MKRKIAIAATALSLMFTGVSPALAKGMEGHVEAFRFACDDPHYSRAVAEAIVDGNDPEATAMPFIKTKHCILLDAPAVMKVGKEVARIKGTQGRPDITVNAARKMPDGKHDVYVIVVDQGEDE